MPRKTPRTLPRTSSKFTEIELERLAQSLVDRGLASPGILNRFYTKPQFNRGTRLGNTTNERKSDG